MNGVQLCEPHSAFLSELRDQLLRGRHILLSGQTHDLVCYSGLSNRPAPTTLQDVESSLFALLTDIGFETIVRVDQISGIRLADPAQAAMYDVFAASHHLPRADSLSASAGDVDAILTTLEEMVQQSDRSFAVVLEHADHLFADAGHPSSEEMARSIRLRQLIHSARFVEYGTMQGMRNTLILITPQPQRIPTITFGGDPRLASIVVGRPGRAERNGIMPELCGLIGFDSSSWAPADPDRDPTLNRLVDLTEGFGMRELQMLPRVAAANGASLDDPRKLVRIARHGTPKDPWLELTTEKMRTARSALRARVIGQDAAVEDMVGAIYDAASGTSPDTSLRGAGAPRGVYFLAGPTGVGKTELCKAVCEFVFGDESAMEVFDMGNYRQEQSGERLTGAAPGYVGFSEGGQLTNRVATKPQSILLFDEIEKAHASVLDTFLSILQDGRLVDGQGHTVWFDQAMVVFTSNIGQERWRERILSFPDAPPSTEEVQRMFRDAVTDHFRNIARPELLGRLGDGIIAFDMLRPQHVRAIVEKQVNDYARALRAHRGIDLRFDSSVVDRIEQAMRSPDNLLLGARCIQKTLMPIHVRKPLVVWFAEHDFAPNGPINVSASETGLRMRSGGRELGVAIDRRLAAST